MSDGRGASVRVGLLVIAGVAAIVGMVFFLTRNRVTSGVYYESYFRESVQGLDVSSPVKFRGVTLGAVTQIGLVSTQYFRDQPPDVRRTTYRLVFVRFVIDPSRVGRIPDEDTAVRLGLRVRLANQGLTGLAYLELDFADPQKFPELEVPWKPVDTYIPSMPSTITQVQDAAQALLAKLNGVDIVHLAATLQTILDDVHGEFADGDLHRTLRAATDLLVSLHDAVDKSDLPGLAAQVKATAASARGLVQSSQARDLLASATRAAERFSDAAAKLPVLIAALQATVQRASNTTSDVTADLAPILRDVQTAVANLRDTSETLRRYPSSVLLGAPPPRREPDR